MERKRAQSYVILLLVLALLCTAVVLRLLHRDLGQPGKPSSGVLMLAILPAIKCVIDLLDKRLDAEQRLLSIAGFVPVSLFLLSLYAPAWATLWLLALAAITILTAGSAAFITGRKLRQAA